MPAGEMDPVSIYAGPPILASTGDSGTVPPSRRDPMKDRNSVVRMVGRAFAVAGRHPVLVVGLALVMAVPTSFLRDRAVELFQHLLTHWLPAHGVIIELQQQAFIAMALAEIPVLLLACVLGALVGPALVYLYLKDCGEPLEDPDAERVRASRDDLSAASLVNFALSHWRRLVWPYTAASLIIWLGSIVIIPGIFYTLFYAFLVPAVTLEAPRRPLDWSRKLTWGRRGRIFRIYLLFIPWWGWYATIGPLYLYQWEPWKRYLANTANEVFGAVIAMALLQLYLERKAQIRRAKEQRKGREAAGQGPVEPEGAKGC